MAIVQAKETPKLADVPTAKVRIPKYPSMLITGRSDAGKSLFASGADFTVEDGEPKLKEFPTVVRNVLFCDADGGTSTLATLGIVVKHMYPARGRLCTLEQVMAIPAEVRKRPEVNVVSIDTVTRLQESLLKPRMGDDYAFEMRDWGYIRNVFSKVFSELTDLGCALICTAHADEREDDTLPSTGTSTDTKTGVTRKIYPERIGPSIQGSFRDLIYSYFDVVAYYAREAVKDPKGTHMGHVLHTRSTVKWRCRSRLGNLIPDGIENPTLPGLLGSYTSRREQLITELKKSNPDILVD